jgi:hypothetical protein
MNKVELYASFISDQVALNEMFGGRDRGYPYKKDIESTDPYGGHFYDIDLHDNTIPARVDIQHMHNKKAMVGFEMPSDGYGISPEAKKTYHKTFDEQIAKGAKYHIAHNEAVEKVAARHGNDDAQKAFMAWGGTSATRVSGAAHHNYGMIATVSKILHDHGKAHPNIKAFTFASSGDHKSRDSLYHAIIKKEGGTREIDPVYGDYNYTIPNPHYKGE